MSLQTIARLGECWLIVPALILARPRILRGRIPNQWPTGGGATATVIAPTTQPEIHPIFRISAAFAQQEGYDYPFAIAPGAGDNRGK